MIKMEDITLLTKAYSQCIMITEQVERFVAGTGIQNGVLFVITNHTTTGILVNEGLECLEDDFVNFMSKLAPDEGEYSHARFLASYGAMANNAPAHLKSLVCGNHAVFMIRDGQIWRRFAQEVYFFEFDGPQERTVSMLAMGEPA